MKPTIKIRFTEPQIALVMRAHPNCNLDHLTELCFEFDQTGMVIDFFGKIKDGGNVSHDMPVADSRAVRDGAPQIRSSTNQRNDIAISKRREAALKNAECRGYGTRKRFRFGRASQLPLLDWS
jgi:hypothetical protein